MNINNAFPSKWLKSSDVEEDLTLTIRAVEVETVGQGEDAEEKPVIFFEETEKGMVLNKTNANTIAGLYTPETDNWVGKKITIFATEVDFGGKQTLALRVRMKKVVSKTAPVLSEQPAADMAALKLRWAELRKQAADAGIEVKPVIPTITAARLSERIAQLEAQLTDEELPF